MLVLMAPLVVAGIVHSAALRFNLLPGLAVPLDARVVLRERPVFGPNKTWRGLILMTVATALTAAVILPIHPPIDVDPPGGWIGLGAAMGLAYVLAELPNSFIKRRLGIRPGDRAGRFAGLHYMLDQADSVVGAAAAVSVLLPLTFLDFLRLVLLGTLVHAGFDQVLQALGVKPRLGRGRRPGPQT